MVSPSSIFGVRHAILRTSQAGKRRAPSTVDPAVPKGRQSKLAKENNITAQEENEIKEAFAIFSVSKDGEKEGVLPVRDVRKTMM
jgi:hypothetical protein